MSELLKQLAIESKQKLAFLSIEGATSPTPSSMSALAILKSDSRSIHAQLLTFQTLTILNISKQSTTSENRRLSELSEAYKKGLAE